PRAMLKNNHFVPLSVSSLPAMLLGALRENSQKVFLREIDAKEPAKKPKVWTYEKFSVEVRKAIAFLQAEGMGPRQRLLILAENSPEWQVMALAAHCLRVEVVGLFATLGRLDLEGILERTQPQIVVISNSAQLEKLPNPPNKIRNIQRIVTLKAGTE